MKRGNLIGFGVCFAVTAGLMVWLLSFESLPPLPKSKVVKSTLERNLERNSAAPKKIERTFKTAETPSPLGSQAPLNIVIEPGTKTAPVPVHTGKVDLVVTAAGLRMRAEPSSRSEPLGNYSRGAKFTHFEDQNGWALVQSLEDGKKGWMFKKYMGEGG